MGHPYNHCEKIGPSPTRLSVDQSLVPLTWGTRIPFFGKHMATIRKKSKNPRFVQELLGLGYQFFFFREMKVKPVIFGIMTFQFIRMLTILRFEELGSPRIIMILFIDVQDEVPKNVSTPKDPKTVGSHETKPSGRWPETCRPEVS